jgi:ATP-binding cassette subfamily B protein
MRFQPFEKGFHFLGHNLLLLVFTQATSAWIKRQNTKSLQSTGGLSSEIQESLQNFKVIVAFDRRDYFRKRFTEINQQTYQTAIGASLANTLFTPVYGFFSNLAQLMVLAYGLVLVLQGSFTIGLLISFLAYVNNFYSPLRQLAALWSSFQVALAGWERVSEILALKTDLETIKDRALHPPSPSSAILAFQAVSFCYPDGKEVLRNISFALEKGKTYALVGPTGGGKTTTASLMARLYDPTDGVVMLGGKDIRTYTPVERSQKIGFILQEPFLFSGTVGDNLIYGNAEYQGYTLSQLESLISERGLSALIQRFEQGLATPIAQGGERMSLGERQLIAFMRAVLRRPDILILDEATANVDTLTEQLLEEILKNLPHETTRIIIAHRLNTIEHADEIFFVNGGEMTPAGSLEHAVQLLMQEKRAS